MSWTAPRTWVSGEVLTAALLNTHVRDNLLETAPAKVSAAGDLVYATAANAIARLGIGTKYQQLRVNAGATAPEWAPGTRWVVAANDETLSSSTSPQNDDELTQAIGANELWAFELFLMFTSPSNTPGFKVTFGTPSGFSYGFVVWTGSGANSALELTQTRDTQPISTSGPNGGGVHAVGFIKNGANAGSLTVQWAQSTSNASEIRRKAGSWLKMTHLG